MVDLSHESGPKSVLPSPRFSRGIGLVLDLFRGGGDSSCGFSGFFLCTCRYFWASLESGGFTSCVIKSKSRLILRLIINTVNYQLIASECL